MATATDTTVATLKTALNNVSPAIGSKSSVRALHCVRIGAGRIHATDMTAHIDAPAFGADFDPVLVPAGDLKRVLGALKAPDWLRLESTVDGLVLESRMGRTSIPTVDVEDWPSWHEQATMISSFDPSEGPAFASMLRDVASFESTDEARPVLTATLLQASDDQLQAVACDKYRLAMDSAIGDAGSIAGLVPISGYIKKLARIDSVESTLESCPGRAFDPHLVRLIDAHAGVVVTLRGVAGTFPDAQQLVPDSMEYSTTLPEGMADAISYMRKVVRSDRVPAVLNFADGSLEVSAGIQDGASHAAVFDVAWDGEHMRYGVKLEYLQEALGFVGEQPTAELTSPLRSLLLTCADRSARRMLVMPMQLPN